MKQRVTSATHYSKWFLLSIMFVLATPFFLFGQSVIINEFMALNTTTLADENGDYSDWIELYNASDAPVDLHGWSLSDEAATLEKWVFPHVTITAKGYLVIFASGKDRATAGLELHTNFKLSGSGEYLALINPEGVATTAFDPAFPEQQSNVSYGYFEGDYVFSALPTPGAVNQFEDQQLLPRPVFSKKHGFYNAPFHVEITSGLEDAQIYYTTDGSAPTKTNGTLYTEAISITTTTALRAITIKSGFLTSPVTTHTYLFLADIVNQPNDPPGYPDTWGPYQTLSGNAIGDYGMDREIIRDSRYSDYLDDALLQIPTISIVTDKDNLFSHSTAQDTGGIYIYPAPDGTPLGRDWERPVSIEYFDADGTNDFQIDCGLRIHGGASRLPEKTPKHSFRVAFRSEYGASRLNYPLFGDDVATSFNTLILRATYGNTFLHFSSSERRRCQLTHDLWAKKTQHDMGHPAGHGNYANLYINGMYWGVYNPTERLDADWAATYLGGNADDYDVIKDNGELTDGNKQAYQKMISLLNGNIASDAIYQQLQGNNPDGTPNPAYEPYMDVVNFIDYMLINYYGGNWDWDGHNWVTIRNRVEPGKGFQFFSWDAEHILEDVNHNNLNLNTSGSLSSFFQRLLKNNNFKRLLADRIQLHFFNGGALTAEAGRARYIKLAEQIDMAIIAESARWGDYRRDVHQWSGGPYDLYDKQYWLTEYNWITDTYFSGRAVKFLDLVRQAGWFPSITAPTFAINDAPVSDNKINVGDMLSMSATMGTIYYTTDGADPWVAESNSSGGQNSEYVFIPEATDKWAYIPKAAGTDNWRTDINFNHNNWMECMGAPGGIGYDTGSDYSQWITLDVRNYMYQSGSDPNSSCYVRIPFTVQEADLEKYNSLNLYVRYDDGFIAYINGVKMAEFNAPASPVWNSQASAGHEATNLEVFDVSQAMTELVAGMNLMAIQALNTSSSSTDFIISAELRGSNQDTNTSGDNISPSAVDYKAPFRLHHSTHIRARVLSAGEWSTINDIVFMLPSELFNLKITEIQYHPQGQDEIDDRSYEFIELKNIGNSTLDLSGVRFTNGISYAFPLQTALNAGEFIVLAASPYYFQQRYGFAPFDRYDGLLDNGGERITLLNADNDTLLTLRYNDRDPWPTSADGSGYSLVPTSVNPTDDLRTADQWRASLEINGSPGRDDNESSAVDIPTVSSPDRFELLQNYPNPFNPVTTIRYTLNAAGHVTLIVYDVLGREIRTLVDERQDAHSYAIQFDASDLTSGVYIYRLSVRDKFTATKKLVLIR
ncbi:lamin tail domain-containing protein [candidate division KSB1 bacterium]|nr:lamin tail domain-containing protein [candidate division KSB1 bacterium]